MKGIRLYVEGGGDGIYGKSRLREGFGAFLRDLKEAARAKQIGWHVIATGPRKKCFEAFEMAVKTHPEDFNILLVDSETPVDCGPVEHLRKTDGCRILVPEGQVHMMVQVMEAWLIADVDTLEAYYGGRFNHSAIPKNQNVEEINKQDIESALTAATNHILKGKYHKIEHGSDLLERVNSSIVRKKASYCDRLFNTLVSFIEGVE